MRIIRSAARFFDVRREQKQWPLLAEITNSEKVTVTCQVPFIFFNTLLHAEK
jgi:hypothetical protein